MEMEALGLLQRSLSLFFFTFAAAFFLFSLSLMLLRWRLWCACDVCCAYVTASWADDGFTNLVDWYAHLLRGSPGRTIHVHVLGNTVTADPANVEHMLKTRFDNYPKGKPFASILGDLLGRGIFAVDGDAWLFQRKMASLELGSVSVRSYAFQIVSAEIRGRLLPLLASAAASSPGSSGGGGSVLDLQDVLRRFSFDTICKISFGLDPCCLELDLPLSEFAAAFDTASRLSASRACSVLPLVWKVKRLLNVGSERELRRAIRLVDNLSREVIRQRRLAGGATSSHDLLSRFVGNTDDERYLRDIVISFLLAGRDTISSGLTTFFLLLSKHPNVEAKILDEITRATVGGEAGGAGGHVGEVEDLEDVHVVSYTQLREMNYLHAALYESMRLYPPVQFDSRFALEDDVLPDGTFIRKGTRLTYHPYAMGRMEELWGADCLEFRPERWLNEDGAFVPECPFRYPVFHAGSRICLGKELALMEMKSVVASVVRRFRVEVVDGSLPPKFASGLTASLAGGLPARFTVRHASRRNI